MYIDRWSELIRIGAAQPASKAQKGIVDGWKSGSGSDHISNRCPGYTSIGSWLAEKCINAPGPINQFIGKLPIRNSTSNSGVNGTRPT